jgi:crotonobetainyl-CoA:carnitine CoA-transferase CaiB-like acyl-CoA transferase
MKAYDLLVQCEAGLASITGSPDQAGRVGVSVCDIACGMYAHTAVLQALLERGQTGLGQGLEVSLFDAIADWMSVPLLHQDYANQAPQRVGLNHPTIAPYGAYSCADGSQIVISIQNNREWQQFCEQVLLRPGCVAAPQYANNSQRCENRAALDEEINVVFTSLEKAELIQRLQRGRIAYGSVNSVADLSRHPQLRRATVTTPTGPVVVVAPPVRSSNGEATLGAIPQLGEQGAAIREEFSARRATK